MPSNYYAICDVPSNFQFVQCPPPHFQSTTGVAISSFCLKKGKITLDNFTFLKKSTKSIFPKFLSLSLFLFFIYLFIFFFYQGKFCHFNANEGHCNSDGRFFFFFGGGGGHCKLLSS
jgi:hypothetical protein